MMNELKIVMNLKRINNKIDLKMKKYRNQVKNTNACNFQ